MYDFAAKKKVFILFQLLLIRFPAEYNKQNGTLYSIWLDKFLKLCQFHWWSVSKADQSPNAGEGRPHPEYTAGWLNIVEIYEPCQSAYNCFQ